VTIRRQFGSATAVATRMRELDLTVDDLAGSAGVPPGDIRHFGMVRHSRAELERLSVALGWPPGHLPELCGGGDPPRQRRHREPGPAAADDSTPGRGRGKHPEGGTLIREIPDEPDFAAEMETREIPAESDFATELEWRSVHHPLLMIAWVGVDYLANELLMTQAAIEDKVKRSITRNGLCPHDQVVTCAHDAPRRFPAPPACLRVFYRLRQMAADGLAVQIVRG
jgi:hypothetical protein